MYCFAITESGSILEHLEVLVWLFTVGELCFQTIENCADECLEQVLFVDSIRGPMYSVFNPLRTDSAVGGAFVILGAFEMQYPEKPCM